MIENRRLYEYAESTLASVTGKVQQFLTIFQFEKKRFKLICPT